MAVKLSCPFLGSISSTILISSCFLASSLTNCIYGAQSSGLRMIRNTFTTCSGSCVGILWRLICYAATLCNILGLSVQCIEPDALLPNHHQLTSKRECSPSTMTKLRCIKQCLMTYANNCLLIALQISTIVQYPYLALPISWTVSIHWSGSSRNCGQSFLLIKTTITIMTEMILRTSRGGRSSLHYWYFNICPTSKAYHIGVSFY